MINKTISDLVKRFGEGSVMLLSDAGNMQVETVSTGSLSLDIALGGGVPRGRIVEVYGPEACLDEDTFIQYNVRTPGGRRQNHKGGTIKRLYERFHGIVTPGKGYYQRVVSEGAIYTVPSFRSDGSVFQNPVADVVKTGLKECFEVSAGGLRIVSTADHKYYVGNGKFAPLSDLRAGDKVFLHAQGRVKGKKEVNRYTETTVKYHPLKPRKHVNGCTYYRVKRANMVYEANMNGLSLEEYTTALNTLPEHEIDKLWVVPKGYVLHHIDEDPNNDSLENLELLTGLEHNKRHAHQHQAKLSFAIEEVAIDSITPVGLRETYDIKCYAPYNNFIAQGFCVHNSGKTSVCLHIIAEAQKSGGYCAFVDMEHALDPEYAAKLGVDLTRLAVSQPDSGEQALEIAEAFVRSGDVDVVVVDSVAALVPQREIEGDMGDAQMGAQARLMSQALRKLAGAVSNSKCILIFTNQIRMKVGVMFGNPETTSGGQALKFYASQRIDIRRVQTLKSGDEVLGNRTRATVVKNKVAPPFKKAEFDILFGKGISQEGEILDIGVKLNVITKRGAFFSYGELRLGQGRDNSVAYLKEHPGLVQELREIIMAAAGGGAQVVEPSEELESVEE